MRSLLALVAILYAASAFALTGVERAVIWTQTHAAIHNHFTGFDDQELAAWDANFEPNLLQLVAASDNLEFWRGLRQIVAALGDGRTHIQLPNDLPRALDAVPIRMIFANGKVLVKKLSSSPEVQSSEIKVGDELISVDSVPVMEYIERECIPHVSGSSPSQRMAEAVWRVLNGATNSPARLVFRRSESDEYSVTLRRSSGPDNKFLRELWKNEEHSVRKLPGHVLYVDVGQRLTANTEQVVTEQLNTDSRIEHLILDLRGTKHGLLPRRLLAKFALFPLPFGAYRELEWRTSGSSLDPTAVILDRGVHDVPSQMIEPSDQVFRGTIVALVSAETAGPAEQLLEPLVFADRVVLIGDTTSGAGGDIMEIAFGRGAKLSVTAREPRWESGFGNGRGFPPRIYVEPTAKGLSAGKDEVLERAIEYLKESAH